ncbi:MAG: shikimate kinase [Oscillospiraceae bacterium]|nr:shikimate kinase [Oscillospiraceae bacterium]
MRSVFLCGFMGCGKSTVGKLLAEMLGCDFYDMDEYIVEREKMQIPEIFSEKGEKYFRETETEVIRELSEAKGVIACGGGAMLKKENSEIASEKGIVIYIESEFEVCYGRISGDKNRPIVMSNTKEELNFIYDSRIPLYKANSAVTVSGNGTPREIAENIAEILSV